MSYSLYQKWKKDPNSLSSQELEQLYNSANAVQESNPQVYKPQVQSPSYSTGSTPTTSGGRYQEPDKYKPTQDMFANDQYLTVEQQKQMKDAQKQSQDKQWQDPNYVAEKKKEVYYKWKENANSISPEELSFLSGASDRIVQKEFTDEEKKQYANQQTTDQIYKNTDLLTKTLEQKYGKFSQYDTKYGVTSYNKDLGYDYFKKDPDNYVIDDDLMQQVKDAGNEAGYIQAVHDNFPDKKYVIMKYNGNITRIPIGTAIEVSKGGFSTAKFNWHMKGYKNITGGIGQGLADGGKEALQILNTGANVINPMINDAIKNGLSMDTLKAGGEGLKSTFNMDYATGKKSAVTFSDNLDALGWKHNDDQAWYSLNNLAHGATGFIGDTVLSLAPGSVGTKVVAKGGEVAGKLGKTTVDEVGDLMGEKIAQKLGMHEGDNLPFKQDLIDLSKQRFVQNGGKLTDSDINEIVAQANKSHVERQMAGRNYTTSPLDENLSAMQQRVAQMPREYPIGENMPGASARVSNIAERTDAQFGRLSQSVQKQYTKAYDTFIKKAQRLGIASDDTANLQRLWYSENKNIPFEDLQGLAKGENVAQLHNPVGTETTPFGVQSQSFDNQFAKLQSAKNDALQNDVSKIVNDTVKDGNVKTNFQSALQKLQDLNRNTAQGRVSSIVDDTLATMGKNSESRQMIENLFKEGVMSPITKKTGLQVGLPGLKATVVPQSALNKIGSAMGKFSETGFGKGATKALRYGANSTPMRVLENMALKPLGKGVDKIANVMSKTYGVPQVLRDLIDNASGNIAHQTSESARELQDLLKGANPGELEQLAKHLGGYQNTPVPERFVDTIDQIKEYSKRSAIREGIDPIDNYIMGTFDEFSKNGKNVSAMNRRFGYDKGSDSISTNITNRNAMAKKHPTPWDARDELAKEGITLTPESNAGKLLLGREANSIGKTERKNLLGTLKKMAEDNNPYVRMDGDRVVIRDAKGKTNSKATEQINDFISPVAVDRSPVGKAVKGVQDYMKTALMTTLPATAMRNIVGGTMMNMTDGTKLSDYAKMLEVMARQSADNGVFRKVSDFFGGTNLGKKFANKEINIGGEKMTARKWGEYANKSGVQNSMFHEDIPSSIARFGNMGWKDYAQKLNILNKDKFIGFDLGKKLLSVGEDLNRGARMNQGLREFGSKGDALSQIGKDVKAIHFDYSPNALTKQEQFVKDYLLPFYTFSRFSTPAVLRQAIKEPGMVNGFANNYQKDFQAGGDNGHNNPYDPEYNKHNIFTGANKDGSKNYFNMSFNPYTQAMDNITNLGGQASQGLNPIIKGVLDMFKDKQTGTGFDITGSGAPQGGQKGAEWLTKNAPGLASMLGYYKDAGADGGNGKYEQSSRAKTVLGDIIPQLNNLTAYMRAGEKDAQPLKYGDNNVQNNLFKNITGLGSTTINHETNKSFAQQDLLRQQQADIEKAQNDEHLITPNVKQPDKVTSPEIDKEWTNEKQAYEDNVAFYNAYQKGQWAPKRSSDGYIKDFFGNIIGFQPKTDKQYRNQLDAQIKVRDGLKKYQEDMTKLYNYMQNGFPTREEYYAHYGVKIPN